MHCRSSRCREVSRHISSPAFAIWITDDILTATFNRFIFRAIRHGSNVPGPLEAQKRLAKRRMGLTAVGGQAVDLGFLQGNGLRKPQDLRWDYSREQKMASNDEPSTPSSMLNWLSNASATVTDPNALDQNHSIEVRIQRIKSLEDLKELQRDNLALEDMEPERFSRLAFERLCQDGACFETLLDFLRDPNLAAPGSGCFSLYMRHAQRVSKSRHSLDNFLDVLQQSLVLGSILNSELQEILRAIKPFVGSFGEENCRARLARAYCRIWDGLKGCRVYTPEQSFTVDLLQAIKELDDDTPVISFLQLELYRASWPRPNSRESQHHSSTLLGHFKECVPPPDYYSILGILSTATQPQILDAYSKCLLNHQPADESVDEAERAIRTYKLKQIEKSYAALINPSYRRKYDEARRFHMIDGESTADHLVYWALLSANLEHGQAKHGESYHPLSPEHLADIISILTRHDASYSVHAATYALTYKLTQWCGTHEGEALTNAWLGALRASKEFNEYMDSAPLVSFPKRNYVSYKVPRCWQQTYRILNRHTMLLHMSEHFRSIGPLRTCRLLLAHSVFEFVKQELWYRKVQLGADHVWTTRLNSARHCFENSPLIRRTPDGDAGILEFANLLIVLAKYELPYQKTMHYVFRLVSKLYGETAVVQVADAFQRSKADVQEVLLKQILKTLAGMASKNASQTTTAVELLSHAHSLAEAGASRGLAGIIDKMAEGLPQDVHSDLMYEVANVVTRAEFLSCRQAFRLVYVCYRQLVSRRVELKPAISRTLVHSGIIRPVSQGNWLSTERFMWLLSIIERVEGKAAALELDKTAYQWRAMVIQSRLQRLHKGYSEPIIALPTASSPAESNMTFGRRDLASEHESREKINCKPYLLPGDSGQ